MTKEELIKENAVLKEHNNSLGVQSSKLKDDFCRVLEFYNYENDYGTRKLKIQDKSWAEIFAEVGKLKAFNDFRGLRETIERLDMRLKICEDNLIIKDLSVK